MSGGASSQKDLEDRARNAGAFAAIFALLAGGGFAGVLPKAVAVVAAAFDGSGAWLVVVEGPSKVGKSRALFEALIWCASGRRVDLVAPRDAATMDKLLTPGDTPDRATSEVLWLDALEPYLNDGVTLAMLREWRDRGSGRIVVATYGGKGSEKIAGTVASGLTTIATEVLQSAREISMTTTSVGELDALRSRVSVEQFESLTRHGLAAYLVAAPQLERKLSTQRHTAGEEPCPEGVALVDAAVDWARCGRTDPIDEDVLRQLWPSYLTPGQPATDDAFAAALEWALRPVAGTIALLQRTGSYQAFDYIVRVVRDRPAAAPPVDASWTAAVESAADGQALTVGVAAYRYARLDRAIEAFSRARESSLDQVAAIAGYNLGVALGELNRSEEAIAVYDALDARYHQNTEPGIREQVAKALRDKGVRLGALGRSEEAIAAYEEVVARYDDATEPGVREAVARALSARQNVTGPPD